VKLLKELNFTEKNIGRAIGVNLLGLALLMAVLAIKWNYFIEYCALSFVAIPVVIILHEALHGWLFRVWTGKVKFGHTITAFGPCFYATSLDAMLSRNRFIAISLIPQVLTALCLLAMFTINCAEWIRALMLLVAAINLGGGSADIYVVSILLRYPKTVRVVDRITGLSIYAAEEK